MKRKGATLAVSLVLLGGLTGSYFALKSYNEKAEEDALADISSEEILNVETADLCKISFMVGDENQVFYLEDGVWKLEGDETFPVDESMLMTPLSQLMPLQAVRKLENAEDMSQYGLDNPQNIIVLTDTNGDTTTVTIGDTNSGTGNDYLMLNEEEGTVYTIETDLRTSFSDDLYDYAYSEELPVLEVSDIVGVTVKTQESAYRLYLKDAKWMVSDETEAAADEVNSAMSSLGNLDYVDFLEHNCEDASAYEINEDSVVLIIHYQEEVEAETSSEAESESEAQEEIVSGAESESEAQEESVSEAESESETQEETVSEAESASETQEETISESETEIQEETESVKIEKTVTFRIGGMDDYGDYYVQMDGSKEVHTIDGTILDNFLNKTSSDWEAQEDETETETEA